MQQFIPLEDDWSLVETLAASRLVPYQPGMECRHAASERQGAAASQASSKDENFFAPPSQHRRAAL